MVRFQSLGAVSYLHSTATTAVCSSGIQTGRYYCCTLFQMRRHTHTNRSFASARRWRTKLDTTATCCIPLRRHRNVCGQVLQCSNVTGIRCDVITAGQSESLRVAWPQHADSSFFLSSMRRHTPPSHASAEACLTGWPNAQPQGWD